MGLRQRAVTAMVVLELLAPGTARAAPAPSPWEEPAAAAAAESHAAEAMRSCDRSLEDVPRRGTLRQLQDRDELLRSCEEVARRVAGPAAELRLLTLRVELEERHPRLRRPDEEPDVRALDELLASVMVALDSDRADVAAFRMRQGLAVAARRRDLGDSRVIWLLEELARRGGGDVVRRAEVERTRARARRDRTVGIALLCLGATSVPVAVQLGSSDGPVQTVVGALLSLGGAASILAGVILTARGEWALRSLPVSVSVGPRLDGRGASDGAWVAVGGRF